MDDFKNWANVTINTDWQKIVINRTSWKQQNQTKIEIPNSATLAKKRQLIEITNKIWNEQRYSIIRVELFRRFSKARTQNSKLQIRKLKRQKYKNQHWRFIKFEFLKSILKIEFLSSIAIINRHNLLKISSIT